ncbi:hypothetical protein GY45DRAFT_534021 [Cubamyces sp. BRFM 1775]|nr:hypothetical protein GY45DRAFT_534021 [Cubamyces sp. BRFM 1775]
MAISTHIRDRQLVRNWDDEGQGGANVEKKRDGEWQDVRERCPRPATGSIGVYITRSESCRPPRSENPYPFSCIFAYLQVQCLRPCAWLPASSPAMPPSGDTTILRNEFALQARNRQAQRKGPERNPVLPPPPPRGLTFSITLSPLSATSPVIISAFVLSLGSEQAQRKSQSRRLGHSLSHPQRSGQPGNRDPKGPALPVVGCTPGRRTGCISNPPPYLEDEQRSIRLKLTDSILWKPR